MSNVDQVLASTVYLEAFDGQETFSGTGFFCAFPMPNDKSAIALVSCRHLLEDAEILSFWLPLKSGALPSDDMFEVKMSLNKKATLHPDPEIDLAAIVIHHIDEHVEKTCGRRPYYRSLTLSHVPKGNDWGDIYPGDDVLIIGCPGGLKDAFDKSPFVRKGSIANLRRRADQPRFFVDAPTLAGASGSPVIVDSHIAFDRANLFYELRTRFYLAGIIVSGLEAEGSDLHIGEAVKADTLPALFQALIAFYYPKNHLPSEG